MTRIKALKDFFSKFYNYNTDKMTISSILADVTENADAPSGGGGGGGINVVNVKATTDPMFSEITVTSIDKTFDDLYDRILNNGEPWFASISIDGIYNGNVVATQTTLVPLSASDSMGAQQVFGRYISCYFDTGTVSLAEFKLTMTQSETGIEYNNKIISSSDNV